MGQAVGLLLGTAGAVIGGVASGGSLFAIEAGFMAGSLLGAILSPPKEPAPSDVRVQDSAFGKFIPKVYGLYRLAGNVIWMGTPHQHSAGGGKGMGGKAQQPYVTVSFAVALCRNTITGVRRIWANGKLIYDVSNPADFQGVSGASQMVTNFTVYPGDENQVADPTMQAALGAANTPPYRGLAYVVFNELNLQQWGNYMPSLTFEVATNIAPAYTGVTASSYTYATADGTLFMAPNLNGQGGTAMGYGYYLGFEGVRVINLNAYGAQQLKFFPPGSYGHGGSGMPFGYSDVPGIYTWPGWLHPDGTWDAMDAAGTMDLGVAGSEANFWRNGNDIFLTSYYPGGRPIYRCDLSQRGLIVAQSGVLKQWLMVGGSASYVYACDYAAGALYQFDRTSLAVTNSWTTAPGGGSMPSGFPGFVVDDDHIYLGGGGATVYVFRPSLNTLTLLGTAPFNWHTMYVVNDSLIMFFRADLSSVRLGYMTLNMGGNPSQVTLSSIVSDICASAGLQPSQYDASSLGDVVTGFAITSKSSPRQALAPLQATYFFDVSDCDGQLKFVRRGAQAAVTVPWDDMGAIAGGGQQAAQNPLVETVVQEFELPRSETISYPSNSADYQTNTQRAFRAVTTSNLDESTNVPIVLSDAEARTRVEAMLWERWTKRQTFTWATSYKYLAYEPTDVVGVTGYDGNVYPVRITKVALNGKGVVEFTGDLSVSSIYPNVSQQVAQGGSAQGFVPQQVPYSGPTVLAVLDVPPLRSQDTSQGLYLAACGFSGSWPGCYVDVSRDDANFAQLLQLVTPTPIGYTGNALGGFYGGNIPDETNTLQVTLYEAALSLSSVSYASFLNGANVAYVGGEIILFRTATQTAPGQYTLSGLLRGQIGTEWAMGGHAAGETFVLLQSSSIGQTGINLTDIGQNMYFETYLNNMFGLTPTGQVTVQPAVARVKPLSPWQLQAFHGGAASTSDITVTWLRRARVNYSWLSGADVPLDESSETYTVTVSSSGTVKRTTSVSGPFVSPAVPTWTYTASMIAADGFTTGQTITITVSQNSDQGVAGYAAIATIAR